MSIQSSINQGLAVAGALYTQTPGFKANKEYKKAEKDFAERGKAFSALTNNVEIGEKGDEITDEQKELFKGKEGAERSAALDLANEGYVAAASKMAEIKPTAENFKNLAHRIERGEQRHLRRQELMDEANKRAEEIKAAHKAQSENVMKKRKSYLDLETSLGGTLRDLKLSKEQKAAVKAQLKENK